MTDVLLCEYLGMFFQIGRCAPLKNLHILSIRTVGFTFRCMDWGLIVTLKGGWGKCGNESLPGGFWALRVEFGDPFFFQTMSLDARIAMVGSDHPFDERMGRLGRKRVVGHNLGLGTRKRLASAPIVLKWGELSRGKKRGRSATVDFDG